MGGINKKFVGNPLGYFRKQKDAQIAKAQAGVETKNDWPERANNPWAQKVKATVTKGSTMTDKEKLAMHDEKAKRFLNKKNKKGPFKGGKSKLKPYN